MKFTAAKPDLNLEVTPFDSDEEIVIESTIKSFNAKSVDVIFKAWQEVEANPPEGMNPIEIVCYELAMVYPREKDWFYENFDPGVLREMLLYAVNTLSGVKKKESG